MCQHLLHLNSGFHHSISGVACNTVSLQSEWSLPFFQPLHLYTSFPYPSTIILRMASTMLHKTCELERSVRAKTRAARNLKGRVVCVTLLAVHLFLSLVHRISFLLWCMDDARESFSHLANLLLAAVLVEHFKTEE